MMEQQFQAHLRVRRIVLGSAGFKGLPVARGRRGVDRIEDKEWILQERVNEWSFGLLQTEGNLPSRKTLLQPSRPLHNGLGRVFQNGTFSLSCGAIIQTEGVPLARPINANESGQFRRFGRPVHKNLFLLWLNFVFFSQAVREHAGFPSATPLLS